MPIFPHSPCLSQKPNKTQDTRQKGKKEEEITAKLARLTRSKIQDTNTTQKSKQTEKWSTRSKQRIKKIHES